MKIHFFSAESLVFTALVACTFVSGIAFSQTPTGAAPATHSASCLPDKSEPNDAEIAFDRGEYKKAAPLLAAAIAANAADSKSRYLEIENLLAQDKLEDASKKADGWTTEDPKNGYGILSEAEIRYHVGDWPEYYALTLKSVSVNPCIASAYADLSEFEYLSGYRATERKHLALAHQLAPNDPNIRLAWIYSLDEAEYLPKLKEYIEDSKTIDDKKRKSLIGDFDKLAARQENRCSLVSSNGPAVIPMKPFYADTVGINSWGLEVAFNGKKRTLQIDTGASGFTLVQSTGAMLGLPKIEKRHLGGLGDEGSAGTVLAKAASVKIGGLEFKNCEVDILDQTGAIGSGGALLGERLDATDGLIGTDIFDHYLVTVDYIKHEVRLDPLPNPEAGAKTEEKLDPLGGRTDPDWLMVDRVVAPSMQGWTKIYRRNHILIVPTRLSSGKDAGRTRLFVMDTGSDLNLIDAAVAKEVTNINENTLVRMQGLSGKTNKAFDAGKFTLDFAGLRLPINSMRAIDLSKFEEGVSGFLGYTTLEQLVMHIDYRDNLVWLEAPTGKKN